MEQESARSSESPPTTVPNPPRQQWQAIALNAARGTATLATHQWRRSFKRHKATAAERQEARAFPPAVLAGDIHSDGVPVLLLPGLMTRPEGLAAFQGRLERSGLRRTLRLRQASVIADPRDAACALRDTIDHVLGVSQCSSLAVIAHGTAGLAARYYAQFLQDNDQLATLITLGTPHQGTMIAKTSVAAVSAQLRPGSDLIAALADPVQTPCRTSFIAYWSDLDSTVLPACHAALHHRDLDAESVRVPGLGHAAFLTQSRVLHDIAYRLKVSERAPL